MKTSMILALFFALFALSQQNVPVPNTPEWEATIREAESILSKRQQHEMRWVDPIMRKLIPKSQLWYFNDSKAETQFLLRNPTAIYAIRNVSCAALSISTGACEAPLARGLSEAVNFEEADAVRHFIFAAGIACRGEEFAKVYTTLHEGDNPRQWSDAEHMDFKNNLVGIAWARKTGCSNGFRDEQLVRAALTALKEGRLTTLEKGRTACADPEKLLKRGFPDLMERRRAALDYFVKIGYNCQ